MALFITSSMSTPAALAPLSASLTSAPCSSPVSRPWRLTRRGRALVVVLSAAALAVLWWVLASGLAQADMPPRPQRMVVVQPGETLWQLAHRVDPQADRREVIQRLMQDNHLDSALVQAGQRIMVIGDS